ncbi:LOW QUALITY PROTEIN: nucleoside-triphosphatase THEP1 [Drosophila gunungcola]|uniref:LOW QUALITY PROTEIN: nucleoside-triphosphatase THEP1 n=1 Tax=Drosophila gunungcola TaxID=103775 RepID=UPI0022DEAE03|nr:LOW QUALITY PROTEIN: nucleoside-triphosphatase THEP1 [Drosophila gunungcola]
MERTILTTIIITGPPGVGKTTLVRKICSNLRDKGHILRGFYTEEVRSEGIGQRIGFDVVTLDGKHGILSRENPIDKLRRPKVGKYSVFIQDFEDLTLPLLANKDSRPEPELLVIDEVGKMELLSKRFESAVGDLLRKKRPLVVTIPEKSSLSLVEQIRKTSGSILYQVTKSNRNTLSTEITDLITMSLLVTK